MQRNCIAPKWLVEIENGGATLENKLAVSYKIKRATAMQACNCPPGHLSQRNEYFCSYKSLYMNFYNSFICNSQTLGTTQMPYNR